MGGIDNMVILSKQTTVTGVSVLKDGDKETRIAFMNATVPQEGNPTIGHAIQDREAFEANMQMVMEDFTTFDNYIYSLFSSNNETTQS